MSRITVPAPPSEHSEVVKVVENLIAKILNDDVDLDDELKAIIISLGPDFINHPNAVELGYTLLHAAYVANNSGLVNFLLEQGADPEARDELGETPIMKSYKKIFDEVVERVLDLDDDIDSDIEGAEEYDRVVALAKEREKLAAELAEREKLAVELAELGKLSAKMKEHERKLLSKISEKDEDQQKARPLTAVAALKIEIDTHPDDITTAFLTNMLKQLSEVEYREILNHVMEKSNEAFIKNIFDLAPPAMSAKMLRWDNYAAFRKCSKRGNLEVVGYLFDKIPVAEHLKMIGSNSNYALRMAVESGHDEIVPLILNRISKENCEKIIQETLWSAAELGQTDVMKYFMEVMSKKDRLEKLCRDEYKMLRLAAKSQSTEILDFILEPLAELDRHQAIKMALINAMQNEEEDVKKNLFALLPEVVRKEITDRQASEFEDSQSDIINAAANGELNHVMEWIDGCRKEDRQKLIDYAFNAAAEADQFNILNHFAAVIPKETLQRMVAELSKLEDEEGEEFQVILSDKTKVFLNVILPLGIAGGTHLEIDSEDLELAESVEKLEKFQEIKRKLIDEFTATDHENPEAKANEIMVTLLSDDEKNLKEMREYFESCEELFGEIPDDKFNWFETAEERDAVFAAVQQEFLKEECSEEEELEEEEVGEGLVVVSSKKRSRSDDHSPSAAARKAKAARTVGIVKEGAR